jgi:hypothetical protein
MRMLGGKREAETNDHTALYAENLPVGWFRSIEESTTNLRVMIVFLNSIGWFTLFVSRINVEASTVPPISKYKNLAKRN